MNDQGTWRYVVYPLIFSVYFFLFHSFMMEAQSGYGQSKWESRQKNEKKARARKERAQRAVEARNKETREKKKVRKANQALDSQSGIEDVIHFALDAPDWIINLFGTNWLKFREMCEEFDFSFSALKSFDAGKYWTLFKESEVFTELYHILQMMITLGFLKKIDISYKNISILVSEPLRKKVSFIQLLEKLATFGKLILSKLYLVYETGNIDMFFKTQAKNSYDDEFTFIKSQKTFIDLGRKAEVSEETYDRRVHECIETTLSFLNTCSPGERAYYSSRLAILRDIQASRTLSKKANLRIKPYGMLLYGKSGVGKSAICDRLTRFVLEVNGYDSSPRAVVSLNMLDRFQSELFTYHEGIKCDDICNTTLEYTDGSPTHCVIMFLNNMPMAALNANAEMKGKVMIEPKVVTATTNVKDLLSNQTSNEPPSINRRFECTITQKSRPELRKDGLDMLDSDKIAHMKDDQFPDYATYTVEEPYCPTNSTGDKFRSGKTQTVKFRPRKFEGKDLVDVDIYTLLRFLKHDSQKHFEHQRNFVESQNAMADITLCDCGMPVQMCEECTLDSQAGIASISEVAEYLANVESRFVAWINDLMRTLLMSQFGTAIIAFLMRNRLRETIMNSIGYYLVCVFVILGYDAVVHVRGSWAILAITLLYTAYVAVRFYLMRRAVVKKFTSVPLPSEYIRSMSWGARMKIVYFLISIGVWKLLVVLAKKWKALPVSNAGKPITLQPDAKPWQQEVEFWDKRGTERKYRFGDAGVSEKSRTISMSDFVNLIGRKLMVIQKPDGEYCDAQPVCGNVIMLPWHMVPTKTEYVTLSKIGGHTFKNLPLDTRCAKRIRGTDFALWSCPGAGLHRDIIDYHPKDIEDGKKLSVITLYNDGEKLVQYPEMTATRGRVVTKTAGFFPGLKYYFPVPTFGGLCMAILVGNADGIPFIAGYHLAGRNHTGGAGFVTRQQIRDTLNELDSQAGIMIAHSATPLDTTSMGIEFGPMRAPHEKCVTRDLPSDARIRVHGAHQFEPSFNRKSAVTTSLISQSVEEIMFIPKIHGPPPNLGDRIHRERDIAGKVDTAVMFDTKILQKAYTDYSLQLAQIPESELAKVGKISLDVNLAGLDGVIGINPINANTAVGFPGKGTKHQFVSKSDRVLEGISCPRDLEPLIIQELEKMEAMLLSGKSINTIFKASFKDEPTALSKDKARIFAAACFAFVLLVRKYFLTLAALVQRNKIITECAVGTVVQSPEWTELYNHIGKHGWDRAIAGDYKKFDGRMSPQFMSASFKLLISIAERSGNYDADDITIMRGIATEITYPTYDYFGTIVQFHGSNPSGHPLTVIINSMVNSLYLRYTYYAIAEEKRWLRVPHFSKVVSAMTYGDDNIMTVAKGYDDFNHTAIAAQLAKTGITYTMADKEAESVPFIHLRDASFLKHYAVWDEELGLYRSPVEDGSVAKMLHTHLQSKVLTMEQSSAEAIQNVALKYFEFGREVYELRREQLEEVAFAAGIRPIVGDIMTYDERLQWYRQKFDL